MELVSVIIPTFKRPSKLDTALKSISMQTYPNIEVIVVDDNGLGSVYDYETLNIANKYKAIFDSFIFIKNPVNMGGGQARNIGIKASSGKYITFLDDDDQFNPSKIELQVQSFKRSTLPNLALVYCQMTLFDEITGKEVVRTNNHYDGNRIPFKENLKGCIAGTPSILVTRSCLQAVNGFRDIRSGQDWALILDILRLGFNIQSMNESLVDVYISNTDRISTSPGKILSLESELKEIKDEIALSLTDSELVNTLYYHHYFQLASALKFNNKRKACKYYLKALRHEFHLIDASKLSFGILFGENAAKYFRYKISKIKNSLKRY